MIKNKNNPLLWQDNFPPVYGHTSVSFLKRCSGFYDAKNGNMDMALIVVGMCIKPELIIEINQSYPDALLIPVISNNKLPEALAMTINLQVDTGIHQLHTHARKTLSAMERLLHKPGFSGKIIKGKNYIIIDDIITQGGTVSALRKHIITHGGSVVAVVALASSAGSRMIAPNHEDVSELINKYSFPLITYMLKKYNIADDIWELTRSQMKYLLCFKELSSLVNKIENTYQ